MKYMSLAAAGALAACATQTGAPAQYDVVADVQSNTTMTITTADRASAVIARLPEAVSNNAVAAARVDGRAMAYSFAGLHAGKTWRDLTADAADNVRIVETAEAPTQGHSIKKVAFAGVLLVAGFLALVAGLLHAFLTPPPGAAPARRKRRDNRGSHREDVTHVHHYEAPPKERLPVLAMVRRNPA